MELMIILIDKPRRNLSGLVPL
jgi:hypothetical protein